MDGRLLKGNVKDKEFLLNQLKRILAEGRPG